MNITEPAYVPKVGDTVRHQNYGHEHQFAVVVEKDTAGFVVADSSSGEHFLFAAAFLSKVEPTPADQWLVFNQVGNFEDAFDNVGRAVNWAAKISGRRSGTVRVARFTFAEWVTP